MIGHFILGIALESPPFLFAGSGVIVLKVLWADFDVERVFEEKLFDFLLIGKIKISQSGVGGLFEFVKR
jgi:hypothetical protein